jgi:hypothetical protein
MGLLRSLAEQLQTIEAKQDSLEQGVAALIPVLTTIVEKLETPPEPKEPPVPIATYPQLYPQLRRGSASTEADADEGGASDERILPEAPAGVAQDVSGPPPERRGWFFTRRTGP